MTDLILIRVNCPNQRAAHAIAESAIEAGLAACANVEGPLQSIYRWDGEIQREYEWVLWLKTNRQTWTKLEAFIQKRHPHDVPAILAIPCAHANTAYEDWLNDCLNR